MNQLKYERIDKGVERIKELPADLPLSILNQGALAHVNNDELIDRLADGAYVTHLARELGVTHTALHLRLKDHPGYKQAMKLRNAAKLDTHQDGIEIAGNALALARAREAFRAASWRAERECPEEWGQKQEVKHTGQVGPLINIQLSVTPGDSAVTVANTPNGAVLEPIPNTSHLAAPSQPIDE